MQPIPSACIRDQAKWCKPPLEFVKLNVGGAIFFDNCRSGIGLILRYEKGDFRLAASVSEKEVQDPETIELLAILRGLQIGSRMGFRKIIVEGDCLLMIRACQSDQASTSMLGNIVLEIKQLQRDFEKCRFKHTFREQNVPAHKLARFAWQVESIVMWEHIPDFITQAIWLDSQV